MTMRISEDEPELWRNDALCHGRDTNDFFPDTEKFPVYSAEYKAIVEELRAFCANCPRQQECLEDAMSSSFTVEHGIWAGTTPSQRKKILREIND